MSTATVREAINIAIKQEMLNDESIFIIGEEVGEYNGAYKVTQGLLDQFGSKRIVDSPISEHGFTGIAVGAAFAGLKPIVEYMTFNFAIQALDQIVNSAAKTCYMSGGELKCPIVFRGPNGAAVGVAAQHSQNYSALYSNIPGLKVIAPYSSKDAAGLLISAIRDPNPVVFLENELLYGESFDFDYNNVLPVEIGKAHIIKEGRDITIITFSAQVKLAINASVALKSLDIDAEVIDIRTIKPIDIETIITSIKKTNRAIVVEEGWFFSGVGASISSIIMRDAFDYLDAPVAVISGKDVPLPYASNLEKLALPSKDEIIEVAKSLTYT